MHQAKCMSLLVILVINHHNPCRRWCHLGSREDRNSRRAFPRVATVPPASQVFQISFFLPLRKVLIINNEYKTV